MMMMGTMRGGRVVKWGEDEKDEEALNIMCKIMMLKGMRADSEEEEEEEEEWKSGVRMRRSKKIM